MMTERSRETIMTEISEAKIAQAGLYVRQRELRAELEVVALRDATSAPHEWLGKKVRRRERVYAHGAHYKSVHGKLCLKRTHSYGGILRGYNPSVGEYYVASLSGKTAYPFPGTVSAYCEGWELDE